MYFFKAQVTEAKEGAEPELFSDLVNSRSVKDAYNKFIDEVEEVFGEGCSVMLEDVKQVF